MQAGFEEKWSLVFPSFSSFLSFSLLLPELVRAGPLNN
jgi:hypothetical protein